MKISKAILDQIQMVAAISDIKEKFSDGQSRELVFVNAIFLDGEALSGAGFEPYVRVLPCSTYEDFDEQTYKFVKGVGAAVDYDLTAVKALAKAALVTFGYSYQEAGLMKFETPIKHDEFQKCATVIGTAFTAADGALELFSEMPQACQDLFTSFMEEVPYPKACIESFEQGGKVI